MESKFGLIRTTCAFCGKEVWSAMGTKYYCTASCKQKMYRWRKKLDAKKESALYIIKDIASYLTFEDSTPSAVLCLNQIVTEALRQLEAHNVKRVK